MTETKPQNTSANRRCVRLADAQAEATFVRPRVLLIEDDGSVADALRKLLESEGFEVLLARSETALDHAQSGGLQLSVLDIDLGTQDGWDLFKEVTGANPDVPAVILTSEWGRLDEAVSAGAEALFEKPIDVPVFLRVLRELLAMPGEQRSGLEHQAGSRFRYVARDPEPFLRTLQERHSAPLKFSASLRSRLARRLPRPEPAGAGSE